MPDDVNYKLGGIDSSLKSIALYLEKIDKRFDDHAKRLRSLEDTRSKQYGALAVVGTVAGIIGSIIVRIVFK